MLLRTALIAGAGAAVATISSGLVVAKFGSDAGGATLMRRLLTRAWLSWRWWLGRRYYGHIKMFDTVARAVGPYRLVV